MIAERPFRVDIETPKFLTAQQECVLVRHGLSRAPQSLQLRHRLASLLFVLDEFDEAILLLEQLVKDSPDCAMFDFLAVAYLSRETPEDDWRACTAAETAGKLAQDDLERGAALATLGKARARVGGPAAARDTLAAALAADPANKDAYKRLVAVELHAEQPQAVLVLADDLIDRGVAHARLLVSRTLALGQIGRIAEARAATGLDRFLHRATLSPPGDWATIEDFNRDLAAELNAHPGMRFDRYGTASTKTWRLDNPATARSHVVPALQGLIQREVEAYVARLPDNGHPWLDARTDRAILHNWCVLTDGEGYEEWHVHQFGWLSGVYYASVPDRVVGGNDRDGCIAFGLPADLIGEDNAAAYGELVVRPYAGLLMLFPSHSYHRTFAHNADQRRICFAFDIKPQ